MNTETTPRLSLNQVAKVTGRSKGTISKALSDGKLSYLSKTESGYEIDLAEALRVFPPKTPQEQIEHGRGPLNTEEELSHSYLMQSQIDQLTSRLETAETERQRERENSQSQIDDLKSQRDQWQKQAEQTLKLQHERDSEQKALNDESKLDRRSEQVKRVRAEKEVEQLREQLKQTHKRLAEPKIEPKRRWSLF